MHRVALLLLACLSSTPAFAGTHWLCGLSDDLTRLVCIADTDMPTLRAATPAAPSPTAAVVRGTRFPLDPTRLYMVDMWSPATDIDFVELLARATLCYRSPGCEVTLSATALTNMALAGLRRPL